MSFFILFYIANERSIYCCRVVATANLDMARLAISTTRIERDQRIQQFNDVLYFVSSVTAVISDRIIYPAVSYFLVLIETAACYIDTLKEALSINNFEVRPINSRPRGGEQNRDLILFAERSIHCCRVVATANLHMARLVISTTRLNLDAHIQEFGDVCVFFVKYHSGFQQQNHLSTSNAIVCIMHSFWRKYYFFLRSICFCVFLCQNDKQKFLRVSLYFYSWVLPVHMKH